MLKLWVEMLLQMALFTQSACQDTISTNGPRNDFIVGVAKGQLIHKIYKYAYTKYTL